MMIDVIRAQETIDGMVAAYQAMQDEFEGHPVSREGRFFLVMSGAKGRPAKPFAQVRESFRTVVNDYIKYHIFVWSETQESDVSWDAKWEYGVGIMQRMGLAPVARGEQVWERNQYPVVDWSALVAE